MNTSKKRLRFAAGICLILYVVITAFMILTGLLYQGNLAGQLLYGATLVVGIGALINKPIVSAVGGLYAVIYHLFVNRVVYYFGDMHRAPWLRLPYFLAFVSAIFLVALCFARPASKILGILAGMFALFAERKMIMLSLNHYKAITGCTYIAGTVFYIAGLVLIGFAFHKAKEKKVVGNGGRPNVFATYETVSGEARPKGHTASAVAADGYCSMGKHVLLLLLTCGIWLYVWTYRTTKFLNCVKGEEEQNPTTKLLLCMFVPFYYIYWTYKNAQRIDILAKEKGVDSDLSTLCLILAIFVGIIPPILMQDKINNIVMASNRPKAEAQPVKGEAQPAEAAAPATTQNTIEDLKSYKELLDMGVITQEEFDAKKKQLLNL